MRTLHRASSVGKRTATTCLIAAAAWLATGSGHPRAGGEERTLTIFNIHNNETTTITFKRDGKFIPAALDTFNTAMRDWRLNKQIKMDPALLDLLWEIHTELGSRVPIQLICGYRSRQTNEMLRSTVGGQASESQHIQGKAADVRFPDVPLKALRYSALIRERGGVGYYPTSALPFVHIDTARVRAWPRVPHSELALLFPSGKTQHRADDDRPITADDARAARARNPGLAQQIANFFASRSGRRPPIAIAGLDQAVPSPGVVAPVVLASYQPPQLIEAPRLADRPSHFAVPSATEQARLSDLFQRAAFVPDPHRAGRPDAASPLLLSAPLPAVRPKPAPPPPNARTETFIAAPDFDEDHPEEVDYRPFPVAALITLTASVDDAALSAMQRPDIAQVLQSLDDLGAAPPMRFNPGVRTAGLLWAQQFTTEPARLDAVPDAAATVRSGALASHNVRTR